MYKFSVKVLDQYFNDACATLFCVQFAKEKLRLIILVASIEFSFASPLNPGFVPHHRYANEPGFPGN